MVERYSARHAPKLTLAPADGYGAASEGSFVVDLDGYEGPLDLLLSLAREQKVDLKQISVLRLAEQYLAYIAERRADRLEIAAEYLVMAAWLAYLKSRLLLPETPVADEPTSAEMAEALQFQLRRLEAMRQAAERLSARARLHRDVFPRRAPATLTLDTEVVLRASLTDLVQSYARHVARTARSEPWTIVPSRLESIEEALARIERSLGSAPSWQSLIRYLPEGTLDGLRQDSLRARSVLAATFAASLELVRIGAVILRQSWAFGPIYLKRMAEEESRG
jgi:segregation and condensation protein A